MLGNLITKLIITTVIEYVEIISFTVGRNNFCIMFVYECDKEPIKKELLRAFNGYIYLKLYILIFLNKLWIAAIQNQIVILKLCNIDCSLIPEHN